jgi:hypothetical protein
MLMAQTSSPAAPPPQDNNTAQRTDSAKKPSDPGATRNADAARGNNAAQTIDNNTRKPDGTAGATGTSPNSQDLGKDKAGNQNADAARAENPDAAQPNPTNAAAENRAGAPWLWIVLGAVALIALLSLLGGRGPERVDRDRVTRIDRIREYDRNRRVEDRDDDIRRAS